MGQIKIGVDPGMTGGVAIIVNGKVHSLHKTPVFEIETGKWLKSGKPKMKKQIDAKRLYGILEPIFRNDSPEVYVEDITHLFGLPSTSNFILGYSSGIIQGILQPLGDFYLISPKKWQNGIWEPEDITHMVTKDGKPVMTRKKPKVDTKQTSLNCARRLFPDSDLLHEGGRVPHDGCIDALLIAEYGGRQ